MCEDSRHGNIILCYIFNSKMVIVYYVLCKNSLNKAYIILFFIKK